MSKNLFFQLRFRSGVIIALVAALITLLYASFLFSGRGAISVVPQAAELVITPTDFPCTADGSECTTGSVYGYLWRSFGNGIKNTVVPPDTITIAWFFRLQVMAATLVVAFLYFRSTLVLWHRQDEKENRGAIFAKLHLFTPFTHTNSLRGFLRGNLRYFVPLFFISILLTYIVSSAGGLLISVLFKGLSFTAPQAIFVSVILAAASGYLLVHWLSAADTRDLLNISLWVAAIGLGGTFYLAEDDWWKLAISQTGIDSQAAPLLTLTLITLSLAFILLMRDIANLYTVLFDNLDKPSKPTQQHLERIYTIWIVAFFLIGFIGIFPNVKSIGWMNTLHDFAAGVVPLLLILTGKIWFTQVMARHLLPRFFRYTIIGLAIADYIFFSLNLFGGISLTAFEIWLFVSMGIWLYGLVTIGLELVDDLPSPNLDSLPISECPLYRGMMWTVTIAAIVAIFGAIFG
ncbi:MAG: hypothetical protein Q9P01_16170 [Anaerolineae bacterium]|nr:hypothetical protein [Anaerolineae bacterium]